MLRTWSGARAPARMWRQVLKGWLRFGLAVGRCIFIRGHCYDQTSKFERWSEWTCRHCGKRFVKEDKAR
jgi:hypothetical protein